MPRSVKRHPGIMCTGKHGRVVYDLERDFGLDPAVVRRRFDFYFDRFAVRPED